MSEYLFKLRNKTTQWKTAEMCFTGLKLHVTYRKIKKQKE